MDEQSQIDSLLNRRPVAVVRGSSLYLATDSVGMRWRFDVAVLPALKTNGLNAAGICTVFSSDTSLDQVHRAIGEAEIILADVSDFNSDVMYLLGLCHGIGRCPLLLGHDPLALPFNLRELRFIACEPAEEDLSKLRDQLTRAIRMLLAVSRSKESS